MSHIDPIQFVGIMKKELTQAAKMAHNRQDGVEIQYKSPKENRSERDERVDIFTQVDLDIQESLLKSIYKRWPNVGILAEEDSPTKERFPKTSNQVILIDPIDGSKWYTDGHRKFCHIVSLMENTEMMASIIYAHQSNSIYSAIRGQGAQLVQGSIEKKIVIQMTENGDLLHHVKRIDPALLTELGKMNLCLATSEQNASDILQLADGSNIGFLSYNPVVYDVWSPGMIIQETGGWLSDWGGNKPVFKGESRLPHLLITTSEKHARRILPILSKYIS